MRGGAYINRGCLHPANIYTPLVCAMEHMMPKSICSAGATSKQNAFYCFVRSQCRVSPETSISHLLKYIDYLWLPSLSRDLGE